MALQTAEQARTRAEEADRVKTEMLGIAAHDLRNPLSSIIGFAELIRTEVQRWHQLIREQKISLD